MKHLVLIAGVREAFTRIFPLGRYLQDFGWTVTVVTPPVPSQLWEELAPPRRLRGQTRILEVQYPGDVFEPWRRLLLSVGFQSRVSIAEQLKVRMGIQESNSPVDRLMRAYETVFAYPDAERTWRRPAIRSMLELLNRERIDAVLSSSPFPTAHLVAAAVKRKYKVLWLADFRDPWTKNHNYLYAPARRWFEERLERSVISAADVLSAASPGYARKQQALHRRPVAVIPVGFDPETVNSPPVPLTHPFTVTYTGTIYPGKQDPVKLLAALHALLTRGSMDRAKIQVRFFGRRLHGLNRHIQERDLDDVVTHYGVIPRGEVLRRQRESHVLLLLNWEDVSDRGVYPLKLFEYLAARRPVIATGGVPGDDVEQVLRETSSGIFAVSGDAVENAFLDLYEEYARRGRVEYRGVGEHVDKYNYREVAGQFAELLDQGGGSGRSSRGLSPIL